MSRQDRPDTGAGSGIKVVLADDHSIVLEGLCRIVEDNEDMYVLATASNGEEAVRVCRQTPPDVAVIDISMPGYDGLEVMRLVHEQHPALPVIVLTMHEEDQYILRAVRSGAKGYISKRSVSEQLVEAIRRVHSGRHYFPEEVMEALSLSFSQGVEGDSPLDRLSMRELQVLRLLAMGRTNQEIAEQYHLSVKTVDTYRLRLLKKLNLRNNAELSRFAFQHNLVEI